MTKDSLFELVHTSELVNNHVVLKFMKTFNRNISISQIIALHELRVNGPQMPSELAKKIGYTAGAMTGIIDKLIKEAYITRQPSQSDRRSSYCKITEKGAAVLTDAQKCGARVHEEIYHILDREEIEQFSNIQMKLLKHLKDDK